MNPRPIEILCDSGLFEGSNIMLIDVGASGGIDQRWRAFGRYLSALAFDPSITGCAKLNAAEQEMPGQVEYIPSVVGGRTPPAPREAFNSYPADRLHAHAVLRKESRAMDDYFNELEPTEYVEGYQIIRNEGELAPPPDLSIYLRPVRTEWPDRFATLDEVLREQRANADFIKIDTDGFDYPVLCGATEALGQCPVLGVLIESQFTGEVSPSSNTFANIDIFMRTMGFSLFGMVGPLRYARADLPAPFLNPFPSESATGQVLWADALYLRDLAIPGYFSLYDIAVDPAKIGKLIAIAHMFDLNDYGVELAKRYRGGLNAKVDVDALIAALSAA